MQNIGFLLFESPILCLISSVHDPDPAKIQHPDLYPWYHLAVPKSRRHIPLALISQKTLCFV